MKSSADSCSNWRRVGVCSRLNPSKGPKDLRGRQAAVTTDRGLGSASARLRYPPEGREGPFAALALSSGRSGLKAAAARVAVCRSAGLNCLARKATRVCDSLSPPAAAIAYHRYASLRLLGTPVPCSWRTARLYWES